MTNKGGDSFKWTGGQQKLMCAVLILQLTAVTGWLRPQLTFLDLRLGAVPDMTVPQRRPLFSWGGDVVR
jgi:hypothetical protein